LVVADDLSYKAQFIPPKGAAAHLLGYLCCGHDALLNDLESIVFGDN
jgi:hypothetical protein